jgi:tetratricopeptide (TPR) repeat protein
MVKNKTSLCLNMIVKNESKIIIRLLESVIPIIDTYCICDTGSTDNTKEIIKEFFDKHNIQGKIMDEPFKNFAHNRNVALNGCLGMSDFIICLDADMKLEIIDFNKDALLLGDHFNLLQGNNDFCYMNTRIITNNGLYKYMGVTHEYINTPSTDRKINIDKNILFIRDIGDGGSKSNKFERDIKLLTDGISDEPSNSRYYFYLANSYHDSGQYIKAIDIYRKRIELGGWEQEVWYSYYRIGLCYQHLKQYDKAISMWLDAYNLIPERLESLYHIINHYRIIGKQKTAMLFYNIAKNILIKNVSSTDRYCYLFLSNDVYTYKIDYEYTIIAIYNNIKNINDEIITVLNNCTNKDIINNMISNMKFYKNILSTAYMIHEFQNENESKTNSSSMITYNDNYLLNISYIDNTDDNNKYVVKNKYQILNSEFKLTNTILINSIIPKDNHNIKDIYQFNNILNKSIDLISIETCENSSKNIYIHRLINDISDKTNLEQEILTSKLELVLKINLNNYTNNNYILTTYNESSCLITNWYPLQITKINLENNSLDHIAHINMPQIFFHIHSSSMESICDNEKWFIMQIKSDDDISNYYNIFAIFDMNMKLLRYSAPFNFENNPYEKALSLIVTKSNVLITYNTLSHTKIVSYNKIYINTLLKYII